MLHLALSIALGIILVPLILAVAGGGIFVIVRGFRLILVAAVILWFAYGVFIRDPQVTAAGPTVRPGCEHSITVAVTLPGCRY